MGDRDLTRAAGRAAFVPDPPLFSRAHEEILPTGRDPLVVQFQPQDAVFERAVRFSVLRARDLLVLDVEARHMRLDTDRSGAAHLVAEANRQARLIVGFTAQHVGEEAWSADPDAAGGGVGASVLAEARLAWPSRLVFAVPDGAEIEFSSEGLLQAMRRLALVVAPAATARAEAKPKSSDLLGHLRLPGGIQLATSGARSVLVLGARAATTPQSVAGLLRDSAALRTMRVHLARDTAIDLRRGAGAAEVIEVRPGERPILGPGGLGTFRPFPKARNPVPARRPADDETAIEAPWRVILSPSAEAGFAHATQPVQRTDPPDPRRSPARTSRVELWHSRLGVRRTATSVRGGEVVSVDEGVDPQRIVRAIWAREREAATRPEGEGPFKTSLSTSDRWQLVMQTAETQDQIAPEPVDVKSLSLSALGAWLDVHGEWEAERYAANQIDALKSWDHVAPMGRDQFVQVVYIGYLYPLGHKAVLIKQTERKIRPDTDSIARLYQRHFIVVAEPERTHEGVHDLPFQRVRILTTVTPPLLDPPKTPPEATRFWPKLRDGGQDMVFAVETIDHDGRHARLHMPMMFLDATEVLAASSAQAIDQVYRASALSVVSADNQPIAFAPQLKPGDTSLEVAEIVLRATNEPMPGGRLLQPRLHAAKVTPPTSRLLTPNPETFAVTYHAHFAKHGFLPREDPATIDPDNAADLFLQVVEGNLRADSTTLKPPSPLPQVRFGSTERSGGFVDPAQQIAGLSRGLGTVGDLQGAKSGTFKPAEMLGDALPKLLGLIGLTELLPDMTLADAPAFVTEALGPIQGLLADLAALQDAAQRAATVLGQQTTPQAAALAAEAQKHATALRDALDPLTEALGDLLSSQTALNVTTASQNIQALLTAFTATVTALAGQIAGLPISPVARAELDRLVRGVLPYLQDAAKVTAAVEQVIAFVQGLDPANLEVRAKLDWAVKLNQFPKTGAPIFWADEPLRVAVEARGGVKSGAGFDASAELTKFHLELVPPLGLMRLHFDRLAFRAGSAGKTDVDVVFGGLEFIGLLSFVETLKDIIPLDGFSDPPFLEVAETGVRAGFSLGLPNVAIGVFSLENISLGADCHVPFLGESLTVGFNFCTRERPFALTVSAIGGGGFLGLRIGPKGMVLMEMALEFGARLSVDLGVASGSVEIMAGIYLRLEGPGGSLTGYLRIRGEVDVLGLVSASIELSMELVYEFNTGKMVGRATITIEVDVFLFSGSVSVSAERRFAGSNGDPTFAQLMPVDDATGASPLWDAYCDAFAPRSPR